MEEIKLDKGFIKVEVHLDCYKILLPHDSWYNNKFSKKPYELCLMVQILSHKKNTMFIKAYTQMRILSVVIMKNKIEVINKFATEK